MDAQTRGLTPPPTPSFREWWAEFISTRVGVRPSGHSNPSLILSVYGGVFDDESDAVMQRLGDYIDGSRDP